VVTLQLDDNAPGDHICMVASYTRGSGGQPDVLITIDGNAYGARKPGTAAPAFDGAAGSAAMSDPGDASEHEARRRRSRRSRRAGRGGDLPYPAARLRAAVQRGAAPPGSPRSGPRTAVSSARGRRSRSSPPGYRAVGADRR
jgi:hypothetical protein